MVFWGLRPPEATYRGNPSDNRNEEPMEVGKTGSAGNVAGEPVPAEEPDRNALGGKNLFPGADAFGPKSPAKQVEFEQLKARGLDNIKKFETNRKTHDKARETRKERLASNPDFTGEENWQELDAQHMQAVGNKEIRAEDGLAIDKTATQFEGDLVAFNEEAEITGPEGGEPSASAMATAEAAERTKF